MTDPVQFDDTTLCDLAHRMGEAEKSRDAEFFEALLAEQLTFRRANGAIVDKTTFLRDLLNPENTYHMLESEDISATVYEGIAVVTLLVTAKGTREGKSFAGVFRNIRIFVHEPDKQQPWQLHACAHSPDVEAGRASMTTAMNDAAKALPPKDFLVKDYESAFQKCVARAGEDLPRVSPASQNGRILFNAPCVEDQLSGANPY